MPLVKNKEDCIFWKQRSRNKSGCKILTTLQCEKEGRCSFFETKIDFKIRQAEFAKKWGLEEDYY